MENLHNLTQRSTEWHEARKGRITASRLGDLMAKTKSGYSASRKNYMAELIVEILTGETPDSYTNQTMQWGIDNEANAKAVYEFITGLDVDDVGFILHPANSRTGASPDGLVGDDGMIEIKCPNTATHIDTLLYGSIPKKYILQMQWQMACAERQWCDFVSFDPRLKDDLCFWKKRINRDQNLIDEIDEEIYEFLREVDRKIAELRKL